MAAKTTPEQKKRQRELYLRKTYGIGNEDYEGLLAQQGGCCAICLCRPRTKLLAVDHDHLTGKIRGLLCGRCNHGLLRFAQEDITILRRAVAYLLAHLEGHPSTELNGCERTVIRSTP